MAKAIRIGNALVEVRDAKTDKPDKNGEYMVICRLNGDEDIMSIHSINYCNGVWNSHDGDSKNDYVSDSESSDFWWCSFGKEIIDVEL